MTHSYRKIFFLLCFMTSLLTTLFSQVEQDIRFTNLDNTDGLPNNSINVITKDNLGFVWIGTNDGLCRYGGPNSIKIFTVNSPEVNGGLQSSNIRSLLFDSKNNLWIGTRLGGLTRYDQKSNTWKTFRNDVNDPTSLCNDEILTIAEDSKGRIWVGTEDGLSIYNQETNSFFSFKVDKQKTGSLQASAVLSIFEDSNGWMWVGTWEGGLSLLMMPEDGDFRKAKFRTFNPNNKRSAKRIWSIYEDNQKRYWIGTAASGLFLMQVPLGSHNKINGEDWSPKFFNYINDGTPTSITNDDIKCVLQDSDGNLWVSTTNGLNSISVNELKKVPSKGISSNKVELEFKQYFYDFSSQTSLINDNVRTIFEDDQGIIWVGTYGGISQINWATNQFEIHDLSNAFSKNHGSQNLYIDAAGVAWYANAEKGILKYDFNTDEIIDENNINLKNRFVSTLFSPDDEHLYVGHNNGVSVLNMSSAEIKHYPIFGESQQLTHYLSIRSLYKDSQNRIWVGTQYGLFVIDEDTGSHTLYVKEENNLKSISDNTINQIHEDSNGDFWLATFQGLNKVIQLSPDKFEFEQFKHDASNPVSIPSNRIFSLAETDGIIYIGSNSGLSGYSLKDKTFSNYSKNNNKYSFQSLIKTEKGELWGGTLGGIVYYNPKTNTFNKYENDDGLGVVVFDLRSSVVDESGNLYFGSKRGITQFNPDDIFRNDISPPVYITDIRRLNPEGEILSVGTYEKEIYLEHDEYYLSLDYAALNYSRPEKNQYAYKLEGFDSDWVYSTKKTPAIYTNLEHGTYVFKVKAANNDGVWNADGVSLKIIKNPAYWETWWFLAGCFFLSVLLLWLGVGYYTRNIKNRNITLQKYNEELNREIAHRKLMESALKKQKVDLSESNANLERSNMDLARSNKDLEQFAYIASHDLQEPLRVVGNFIGLLRNKYSQHFDKDAYEYIDFAIDGVYRMSEQVKSILTFSRVIQNKSEFQLTKIDEIINSCLHDLSLNIQEKNVKFMIEPLPEIFCDKNLIQMVFYNLIENGMKFNDHKEPLITIAHQERTSDGFWQFSIKDNGIGIHEDSRVKIFDIFKRLHSRSDYEGTGIGLALCQKIIHRHGGEIWVDSKENEGVSFYFTIKMP